MTEAEKIICKMYLDDMDKNHTCNEYKLLMQLLEQEPCTDAISRQYLIDKAVSWDKHFANGIRYVALTDILNAPSVNPNLQMLCKFCVENGQPLPCPCDYYSMLKGMEVQE